MIAERVSDTILGLPALHAGVDLGIGVFLSRLQFAFLTTFHFIFPAFTVGLAAWLATIDGARLATGDAVYRRVFDFRLKVFAVSFGLGVVTGIVKDAIRAGALCRR